MRIALITYYDPAEMMGGSEYQTMLLAQGLRNIGHEVLFIATHSGETRNYTVDKLEVRSLVGWRKFGWRSHEQELEHALRHFAPDICYVRVFEELELATRICRRLGIPVVSTSCSMRETSPVFRTSRAPDLVAHFRSFLSIPSVAAHVCNTIRLTEKISRWFPRAPRLTIYNGQPVPEPPTERDRSSGQIIWVNNLKRVKRPELFIKLAGDLPQYQFTMVGRMADGRYAKRVRSHMENAPLNFRYLGPKPVDDVNSLLAMSELLVSSSRSEGFGNSFLQAWFRGVPTLSLGFELDGIIEREGIGRCAKKYKQLVSDADELMLDKRARSQMGRRARAYAIRNHDVKTMVSTYETLFSEVTSNHATVRLY